jgi:hypothetical protein
MSSPEVFKRLRACAHGGSDIGARLHRLRHYTEERRVTTLT